MLVLAAAWATFGGSTRDTYLFLVSAPLLAIAAVAAVFATRGDPAGEVIAATPMAGLELLLARWASVVVPAFAVTGLFSIAVPGIGWTAMAAPLCVPGSFDDDARQLAAGTWGRRRGGRGVDRRGRLERAPRRAAPAELIEGFVAFRPAGQATLAVLAAAAGVVLVMRSERFEMEQTAGGLT